MGWGGAADTDRDCRRLAIEERAEGVRAIGPVDLLTQFIGPQAESVSAGPKKMILAFQAAL